MDARLKNRPFGETVDFYVRGKTDQPACLSIPFLEQNMKKGGKYSASL